MKLIQINTLLFEELVKAKKESNGNSLKIGDFLLRKFNLKSLHKMDDNYFYVDFLSLNEEEGAISKKKNELVECINDVEALSEQEYIILEGEDNQLSFGELIMAQPYVTGKPCSGLPPSIKDEESEMWEVINKRYEIVKK